MDGATVTLWRTGAVDGRDPALAVLDGRGVGWVRYEREEADLASACRRLTGASIGGEAEGGARGPGRGRGRGRKE